jgi:ADP-ribose pyrophosphatase YjhB (NUDIX family)
VLSFLPSLLAERFERAQGIMGERYDYHGVLVVALSEDGEIVFIHPPGAPAEAPASLPSNPCQPGEDPRDGAIRVARELTGLHVTVLREFSTFVQEGTPTGTMLAHCYLAEVTGGTILESGPEGPVRFYRPDALPHIVPIRVANQRALQAYVDQLR